MLNPLEGHLKRFFIPFLTLAWCAAPAWAQAPLSIALDDADTGRLMQTGDYSLALKGTVSAPGGLSAMYTIDEMGSRGEIAFRLLDATSGTYSFTAGTVALRPGLNRITVVAAGRSNAATSAEVAVLSNRTAAAPLETRRGHWMGRQMTVQIKDGMVLYEGDMILGAAAEFERAQTASPLSDVWLKNRRRDGLTTAFTSSLWPTVAGVVKVPYIVTSGSADMTSAIASFNSTFSGLIQWVPRAAETDYVNINLNSNNHSFSCVASLGRTGGAQDLSGSIDCQISTLLHEMGHAIGLYHEHQRPDYASYVLYNATNIDAPIQPGNFGFVTSNSQPVGLYDYSSIMHYGAFTFSKNEQPVLETIPAGMPIGESTNYSAGDIDQIKRLYDAAPTQVTVTTNPPGLPLIVDSVSYTAPHTFAWSIGSGHTIGTPAGYQTLSPADGAQYLFGNWNDAGSQTHSITITAGSGSKVAPASSPAITVYAASYQRYNPIATQAFGGGSVQLNPVPTSINASNYYLSRTAVTATAAPSGGNVFTKWYGNDYLPTGQNPKPYFISDNPYSIQAQFASPTPVYTIASAFTNNSPRNPAVTANVDGNTVVVPVNFTSADAGWTTGSIHTLNASTPQSPVTTNVAYKFSTWNFGGSPTSAPQSITLPGVSTSYMATFIPSYRGYSIVSPSCAANAPNPLLTDRLYDDSSLASFQVNPISGWFFAGFSGSLTGLTNPQSLTVHDQFVVTANLNTAATPLTIAGFTPSGLPQGAATQMVTITGTGFTASTIVYVNGSYNSGRLVSFVDSQHMQVQIGAADLAAQSGFPIGVQNFLGACSVYADSSFLVNTPAASAPSSVTANIGTTPQTTAAGAAFPNALAVTVRDAASSPVSGVNVNFAAPGAGASGTFTNASAAIVVATNASGIASAPFTANSIGGSYNATASVSGVASPATFSLTNTVSTYSISGQVLGAAGVTIALTGSQSSGTTANGTGNYSFSGLVAGGTYTVTPSRAGSSFSPAFTTFTNLQSNQTANFAGRAIGVSKVGAFDTGYWVQDLNGNFVWDGLSVDRRAYFSSGQAGEIPVYGDWNGDGKQKLGTYINGTWILDYNGNGQWDGAAADKLVYFGGPGWTPVVGDWNGDGKAKMGAYKDGTWMLDYDGNYAWNPPTDKLLYWGGVGYAPVLGDWNASGWTKIGVHKEGLWLLDYDGDFAWNAAIDKTVFFGGPSYTPVVGDWNGSGNTKIGATLNGLWVIDYNGNFLWDGTVTDRLVFFGGAGYIPMVGDWDGSGKTKVGAYKDGTWVLDVNGNFTWDPPPDQLIFFGGPGQIPVAGRW